MYVNCARKQPSYDCNITYLIVIHDSVEGLDPHGVNVTIQNNPFGGFTGVVGKVSHNAGIEACNGGRTKMIGWRGERRKGMVHGIGHYN